MEMWSIYIPHIECLDAITRIICKKYYKLVHVGKQILVILRKLYFSLLQNIVVVKDNYNVL